MLRKYPAQRPIAQQSVPVSHHSLIKQSTGLFYFIAHALRSSTLSLLQQKTTHTAWCFVVGGDEESRTPVRKKFRSEHSGCSL